MKVHGAQIMVGPFYANSEIHNNQIKTRICPHCTYTTDIFLCTQAPVHYPSASMKLDTAFVKELKAIHPEGLMQLLQSENRPHFDTYWTVKNEILPVDLYCYLYTQFAPPNGIQNLCR